MLLWYNNYLRNLIIKSTELEIENVDQSVSFWMDPINLGRRAAESLPELNGGGYNRSL